MLASAVKTLSHFSENKHILTLSVCLQCVHWLEDESQAEAYAEQKVFRISWMCEVNQEAVLLALYSNQFSQA
nr:hypothetical protein CFP56_55197 [Quercus suber]